MKCKTPEAADPRTPEKTAAVAELLAHADPVYAGTLGLDGRPEIRPIRFLAAREGALYFLTAKHRRLYAELCKTPYVRICARDPETEAWLRISAKVCFTEDPELLAEGLEGPEGASEQDPKALIAFFLLGARAEWTAGFEETPLRELVLPDPTGVYIGLTIKKKPELRDRISRILERREAEPPAAADEAAKLYDGALFLFAETAKALWPRMDIRPIERATVFETWDERERYTKLAAALIGNAVIDKPEDLTWWLSPETLETLRSRHTEAL